MGYVMAWEVTLEYNNTCFVVVVVAVVNIDDMEMPSRCCYVAGLVQVVNALKVMPWLVRAMHPMDKTLA